jgi:hypothetical protein
MREPEHDDPPDQEPDPKEVGEEFRSAIERIRKKLSEPVKTDKPPTDNP